MDRINGNRAHALFFEAESGAKFVQLASGSVIYHTEMPARFVYLVKYGQVRVFVDGPDGSTRLTEIYGPGEWFGVAALAGYETYAMRAVTAGDVSLMEVPIDNLRLALNKHPAEAVELMRELAERVMRALDEASRLVFEDSDQRLINALLRFSKSSASSRHSEGVSLKLTHQQLAQAIGVARETVSLALTSLRQKNLLRTGRRQLIFDPEALRRFGRERQEQLLTRRPKVPTLSAD